MPYNFLQRVVRQTLEVKAENVGTSQQQPALNTVQPRVVVGSGSEQEGVTSDSGKG